MMSPHMMFTMVICKILLARMPLDIIYILSHLIAHPIIPHFHIAGALLLYGVVCNTASSGIIAMYGFLVVGALVP
jgi:hypothetical protein